MRTRTLLPLCLLSSAAFLSGCANFATTAATDPTSVHGAVTGTIYGGQQPIVNATVTLWAAGNTGYGSAAKQLATTTSSSTGSFSFGPGSGNTYTCPVSNSSTASPSIYITATGGQPTPGVTNTSIALLLALGDCLTVQTTNPSVNVNELTTVASITALQQFFAPGSSGLGSIGTSPTNALGLANAMRSVANLVNTATGNSFASTTVSGAVAGYTTNPVVTVTPEQAKLDTMADILAACVNSATGSTQCSTLFGNVGGTTAKDTLQAAYYMATVPAGSGATTACTGATTVTTATSICNLYALASSMSPFQPTLASAPTDWTVGVTFSSASTQTIGTTPVYFLSRPEYLAVDSLGNIWAVNYNTSAAGVAGNSVSELSTSGVPLAQVLTAPGQLAAPRNIAIDPNNNIFVGNYGAAGVGNTIAEYNATTLSAETFPLLSTGPDAIVSDGTGNIYIANYGGAAGAGDIEILPANAPNGTPATQIATGVSVGNYSSMAIDSYDDLWLSNNPSTATTQFICTANPCTATTTTAGGQTGPQSIAIDHANNVWIGNYSTTAGSVSELAATNTSSIIAASSSPFTGGGLLNPTRAIFGGLGSQWITNFASGAGTVTELTSAGAPLSPAGGYVHTFSGPEGIAIDASGNVWVGNYSTAAPNSFITEIVGASGPAITPYAANLPTKAGGANTIGNRP
jgi:hypothetical protein